MANYGISFYGTGTYGAAPFIQLEASGFKAEPQGYGMLLLSWSNPYGTGASDWNAIRLVRSSYGFPASPYDGVTLFEDPKATARTSYLDTDGLQEGRFYYYSLFARLTSDGTYRLAGRLLELIPGAHAYGETLWDHIPQFYKERDYDYRGVHEDGPLHRFLGMVGYQLDRVRTEIDSLRYVADIDRVSGGLLPVLAESLGVTYEPELGMKISRGIVKNAIHLAKIKGTVPGVEGVASAYTSFGATAIVGKNLMLDKNASGFIEPTPSTWSVIQNATLTPNTEQAYSPPVASTATMTVVGTGAGDAIVRSGTHAANNLIPTKAGTTYTASLYTMHLGTARTFNISLVYYSFTGTVLGTFNGTAAANTGAWVRRTVTGLAPANTAWAAIQITITGPAAAEGHLIGAPQLEAGAAATTWESARQVKVYMAPERTNLVANPSFEVNTNNWAATNAALARVTTPAPIIGVGVLRMTASGAGTIYPYSDQIDVVVGETYTCSAYVRTAATARQVRAVIQWDNAAGNANLSYSRGTSTADNTTGWTRVSVTGVCPVGGGKARVGVEVLSANGTEIHYADAFLFEQTEFLKDYFDAAQSPAENYLWAGSAHASASYFYPRRDMKNYRLLSVIQDYLPAGTTISTHYTPTVPATAV